METDQIVKCHTAKLSENLKEWVYSEIDVYRYKYAPHLCDKQDLLYWLLIPLLINKEHLWSPLTVETVEL